MAFQNITFPNPKDLFGLTKEVLQQTKIISNGNVEYRLSKNDARHRWVWPSRNITKTEMDAILTFISNVNMSLDSFKFVDPFTGTTYHVRFDMASFSGQAVAFNRSNQVVATGISEISLIEVFE